MMDTGLPTHQEINYVYVQNKLCMRLLCTTVLMLSIMFNAAAQMVNSSAKPTLELEYLVRQPTTFIQHPPVLFLFHGAGSNEQDMFSLASRIPDEWLVISARAPYMISEGQYKWYDVKMVDNTITMNFSQEEESRKAVLKFMDEVIAFYHADRNRVVLAGFSQGANMASVVSLTTPEKVIGFAIFSGRFIEEITPLISTSASLKSVQCFLAHGNRDNMLPIAYAGENQQKIQLLGISVTFSEDASAHTISQKQYKDFLQWLKQF